MSLSQRGIVTRWGRPGSALLLLLASVSACGGKYEDSGNQPPDTATPAPGGTGSSQPSPGSPGSLPTHPLDACIPGFERTTDPTRACPWITEKRECFDSFDAACACICPTSGNSLCSAGFSSGTSVGATVYCDPD